MKYTQRQWDREAGWGKVPKEYAYETKLEEYKRKINYDVWEDVINVKGEEMSNPQFDSLWNPWNTSYKNVTVNLKYTMKAKDYVYTQTSESTKRKINNDESKEILRNTRGK